MSSVSADGAGRAIGESRGIGRGCRVFPESLGAGPGIRGCGTVLIRGAAKLVRQKEELGLLTMEGVIGLGGISFGWAVSKCRCLALQICRGCGRYRYVGWVRPR
jgi:hypothetical protein